MAPAYTMARAPKPLGAAVVMTAGISTSRPKSSVMTRVPEAEALADALPEDALADADAPELLDAADELPPCDEQPPSAAAEAPTTPADAMILKKRRLEISDNARAMKNPFP